MTDCAALYEQNAIALEKIHVHIVLLQDESGSAPGHNCIFLPGAVACTMHICWYHRYGPDDGQGEERKRKSQIICTRSYTVGRYMSFFSVDVV